MMQARFTRFPMRKGEVVTLARPLGRKVRVAQGQLWITQSDDRDDHFVSAGGSFVPESNRLLVAEALCAALVTIEDLRPATPPRATLHLRLATPRGSQ
jgi:hypothetical protein